MANQFLNAVEYANVMLLLLKNKLVLGKLVDGQFRNMVSDENGLVINVKRPPRFIDKKDGTAAIAAQDILTGSVPITVSEYSKVHVNVGDIEYVTSYNALMRNQAMKSAAATLANSIDTFLATKLLGFNSWVAGSSIGSGNASDPSKPIATPVQAFGAYTRLQNQGCPDSDLSGIVTPLDGELLRGSLTGGFIQGVNRTALERASLPLLSAVDYYQTQQCPTLTTGTRPSTGGLVNGANQNVHYRSVKTTMVSTLNIDTLGNSKTIKAGEVFTIAGVYAWDWRANGGLGQALDYLQQFTVTANVTSDVSAGTAALVISPPIIVQGQNDGTDTNGDTAFATVDSIPADNAAITFAGALSTTFRVRAAWQKQAISLVTTRLRTPDTGVSSFVTDPETGISIRYWRASDVATGNHYQRFDCMYGAAVMDPNLGTRICGS